MNKTDKTKQIRHGILLLKCLHLPKPAQQRLNYHSKTTTSTSKQLLYKLCFTVEQPLIHETAGLFPVKIEKKKPCCTFVNLLTKFKTKKCVKEQNTSFQNEKQLLGQSLYSRMRITWKTVHNI